MSLEKSGHMVWYTPGMPDSPDNIPYRFRKGIIITFILIVLVLAVLISLFDLAKLLVVFRGVNGRLFVLSMVIAWCAYGCVFEAHRALFRELNYRIGLPDFFRIIILSVTTNYLVATGGAGGIGLRALMFRRHGIPAGTTIAASVLYLLISNVYLVILLVAGVLTVLNGFPGSGVNRIVLVVLVSGIVLAASCGMVFMGSDRLRGGAFRFFYRIMNRVLRTLRLPVIPGSSMESVELEFRNVGNILVGNPRTVIRILLFSGLDWCMYLWCFRVCFEQAGCVVPFGLFVTGVGIGLLVSILSMIPGGLGVMEGSMTYFFVSFGYAPERIVVAVILLRIVYYVIPFLLSLGISRRLLMDAFTGGVEG